MVNETEDWFIVWWCPRSFWPRFPVKARAYPVPPRWLDAAMALVYLGRTNWFLVEYQLAGTELLETQASAAPILARIRLDRFGFWLLSFTAYFFWIFTVVRDYKDLG